MNIFAERRFYMDVRGSDFSIERVCDLFCGRGVYKISYLRHEKRRLGSATNLQHKF